MKRKSLVRIGFLAAIVFLSSAIILMAQTSGKTQSQGIEDLEKIQEQDFQRRREKPDGDEDLLPRDGGPHEICEANSVIVLSSMATDPQEAPDASFPNPK